MRKADYATLAGIIRGKLTPDNRALLHCIAMDFARRASRDVKTGGLVGR